MAQFQTQQFGAVEYGEESVILFPEGLAAFETDTRFMLIERPETAPVVFLQSLLSADLCFITLPVTSIEPDYVLSVPPEELRDLGADHEQPGIEDEFLCLATVTLEEGEVPTANLMAPLLIHRKSGRARQVIQPGAPYSFHHPLSAARLCRAAPLPIAGRSNGDADRRQASR